MTKLTNKQYNKLVKCLSGLNIEELTIGDLQSMICDDGLCPIESCPYYNVNELVCPHLTEVCQRLKGLIKE